jgi:hypothetical protein
MRDAEGQIYPFAYERTIGKWPPRRPGCNGVSVPEWRVLLAGSVHGVLLGRLIVNDLTIDASGEKVAIIFVAPKTGNIDQLSFFVRTRRSTAR